MIRKCRVHAVTDSTALADPSFEARAEALAGTGLTALALRAGAFDGRSVYNLALRLREITGKAGVPLIINSRLDIALAAGADFVQLGYHSVPLEAAAPLCKARGLGFGCSCHSLEQARQAVAAGAS
ncbi:thiamine phosphate synthase, partial [bacterium]|nr:thiamine phosphate synthase [bacterium]